MSLTKVSYSMINGASANVVDFGAVGDGVTDDTAAIQAAIYSLNKDGVLLFPAGEFICTQLVCETGLQIRGSGSGVTYIKQKAGETIPLFTDDFSGVNILIYDISFDGNNNAHTDGIVNLGFNGAPFGTVAMIKNCYIRNTTGTGLKLNGNVCVIDTVELVGCSIGMDLIGPSNLLTNVITANCSDIGLNVTGARNIIRGFYAEGQCSTACLNITADSIGTQISGVTITGIGANIHGAGIKLNANCFLTNINGAVASVTSAANLTNGLIYDLTFGTRKLWGRNRAGIFYAVSNYLSGARAQLPYIDSIPPTIGTHLEGDWWIGTGASQGIPIGWVCVSGGTPGTFSPMLTQPGAVSLSSDATLVRGDIGKRFQNDTATALITVTLPATQIGDRIHFTRRNTTHGMRIDPSGSQLIRPGGAGKYLSLDTDGASVTLEYMSANSWVIVAQSGTVSFDP